MTKHERAIELKKRGYPIIDIAPILGWDNAMAVTFFNKPEIKELCALVRADEIENETEDDKSDQLETLDDRLSALEHRAIGDLFSKIATADINSSIKVFESVGKRRAELAKQTGAHAGTNAANAGKVVVLNINANVRAKLVKNEHNQIIEVAGRELRTLDRESILDLTKVPALDKLEALLT